MTERKKPGVAFWATVAMVVLVLYVLSLLLIRLFESQGMISRHDRIIGGILWMYCTPARGIIENGPAWIRDSLVWAFGN
jgi:hypothetical protein